MKTEIIKEAKRLEECATYSSKGHFCAAKRYGKYDFKLGISIVVLSVIAGSTAFADYKIITIVASLLVTVLSSILTFCKFSEKSTKHFNVANEYSALEINLRYFYNIEINCLEDCVASEKLGTYISERNRLNADSLVIEDKDYEKAKSGIEKGENKFEIDGENK